MGAVVSGVVEDLTPVAKAIGDTIPQGLAPTLAGTVAVTNKVVADDGGVGKRDFRGGGGGGASLSGSSSGSGSVVPASKSVAAPPASAPVSKGGSSSGGSGKTGSQQAASMSGSENGSASSSGVLLKIGKYLKLKSSSNSNPNKVDSPKYSKPHQDSSSPKHAEVLSHIPKLKKPRSSEKKFKKPISDSGKWGGMPVFGHKKPHHHEHGHHEYLQSFGHHGGQESVTSGGGCSAGCKVGLIGMFSAVGLVTLIVVAVLLVRGAVMRKRRRGGAKDVEEGGGEGEGWDREVVRLGKEEV
ncbi:hypothetical protein MMC21_001301 [Puttea exsequens]|nr:hypothetical protein [Puttea exsequens]